MKKVITGIGLVIDLTTFVVIARLDGRKAAAEEKLQDFEDYITRLEASAAVPLTPLAGAGSAAAAELNEMMDIMNAGEREALKQNKLKYLEAKEEFQRVSKRRERRRQLLLLLVGLAILIQLAALFPWTR